MQEPAGTISQNGSNHDQLYPLGMGWAITLPVSCHAALLPLPVMHAKTLMNPAPSPSPQDRLEKICAQGKLWQNRGSQAEEDHPQMKGTGGDNPCKHGKWRKRKTDDSLRIKREQLPQMVRPFCVPLKLFLKRRQAVRLMYYFTWLGISKFCSWTESHFNIEHQGTVEERDDSSTILLQDSWKYRKYRLGCQTGRFTCELKLLQVHLFGQGVFECQFENAGGTDFILNHYYWQEIPGFHIHLRLSTSSLQST